jgi:GNAT superfamily N-acetyltransferase
MADVEVVRADPDDWMQLRDLRLAALQDAPKAFGSTYARERDRTEDEWRQRLGNVEGATFFAIIDGRPAGLAAGYRPPSGRFELVSMWVSPTVRGRGAADALIRAVAGWAVEQGEDSLWLWVTRGNDVAERAYARHGFVRTGDVQPMPHDPCVDEIGMVLGLEQAWSG